jgi:hypothetical protein
MNEDLNPPSGDRGEIVISRSVDAFECLPMIYITVSAQRAFTVPAGLGRTTAHFRDFGHTLDNLAPHLRLAATYARDQYRMLYSVTEAGVYHVAFYCDIQVRYDESSQTLHVTPLEGVPPVAPKATLNSLTGQGYYRSCSAFQPAGPHTRITYDVEIQAEVPKRLEWKLIPDAVITRLVEDVVQHRLNAITDTFIDRAIDVLRSEC